MDSAVAIEFIRANHHAVFLTYRRDGTPQLSPVVAAVGKDGRVIVSSRETAMKAINIRRNRRVSLCAFSDSFFGPWVQVDGLAEIVDLPGAMDGLVEYYRLVSGEHPDWDEYSAAMVREHRVLLEVTVSRAGPDRSG